MLIETGSIAAPNIILMMGWRVKRDMKQSNGKHESFVVGLAVRTKNSIKFPSNDKMKLLSNGFGAWVD